MNSARNLNKRLLNLFPVHLLKEEYKLTGKTDDLLEAITGGQTRQNIINFVFANHNFTKQHIYLFNLNKNFRPPANFDDFPIKVEKQVTNADGEILLYCLPIVKFSVYLSDPMDKVEINFHQPVLISLKNKAITVQYTKLEKNISFYFPSNRDAKKAAEINSEEETLSKILTYFNDDYTVSVCDINAGIKHLWDIDNLDCFRIAWQNPFSSVEEKMNGDLTFKKKYPEQYEKIILTPLGKSVWKYLLKDDYLCDVFAGDPSTGKLSITTFPKTVHQIKNVITKILANN